MSVLFRSACRMNSIVQIFSQFRVLVFAWFALCFLCLRCLGCLWCLHCAKCAEPRPLVIHYIMQHDQSDSVRGTVGASRAGQCVH